MGNSVPYQERSLSSFIIGMFLVKLTFFTLVTSIFIAPSMTPNEANDFACNTFLISNYDYGTTTDIANDGYGDIALQSTSSVSNALTGLSNLATCAFTTTDIETYFENTWKIEIPFLISFLLFQFWGNLLLFLIFVRTKFKV